MSPRCLLVTGPNQIECAQLELPPPAEGEVLVESQFTTVSPGTELRVMSGQEAHTWGFIPGYSLSGRVVETGPGVDSQWLNRPVFITGTSRSNHPRTWGGHVSHAIATTDRLFPVPEGVDMLAASLTHLAAIAYHGVRLSHPLPHESVVVVGLGPIGQLSARLHAVTGAKVLAVDISPERVALAARAGVDATVTADSLKATVLARFPEGAEVVVDCTGSPAVLPQAIELARDLPWDDSWTPAARFLVQGSYAGDFRVPYQTAFLKQLSFLIPRDCQPRDMRTILDLLGRRLLKVDGLVGEVVPAEDAPLIYEKLRHPQSGLLTAAFSWSTRLG